MAKLHQKSLDKLSACHPDLQVLAEEVSRHIDYMVVWGYRNKGEQDKAFAANNGVAWPTSKHNHLAKKLIGDKLEMVPESLAIDVAPLPLDWKNTDRFCVLLGVFLACSSIMQIPIRLGPSVRKGDYGHIELDV